MLNQNPRETPSGRSSLNQWSVQHGRDLRQAQGGPTGDEEEPRAPGTGVRWIGAARRPHPHGGRGPVPDQCRRPVVEREPELGRRYLERPLGLLERRGGAEQHEQYLQLDRPLRPVDPRGDAPGPLPGGPMGPDHRRGDAMELPRHPGPLRGPALLRGDRPGPPGRRSPRLRRRPRGGQGPGQLRRLRRRRRLQGGGQVLRRVLRRDAQRRSHPRDRRPLDQGD